MAKVYQKAVPIPFMASDLSHCSPSASSSGLAVVVERKSPELTMKVKKLSWWDVSRGSWADGDES